VGGLAGIFRIGNRGRLSKFSGAIKQTRSELS
jgi:hypothetical protein